MCVSTGRGLKESNNALHLAVLTMHVIINQNCVILALLRTELLTPV